MTLETILAGYSSTALAELAKAHGPGGRAASTKPANVALLAAALRDPNRCGALRLTPSERALLAAPAPEPPGVVPAQQASAAVVADSTILAERQGQGPPDASARPQPRPQLLHHCSACAAE